MREDAGMQLVLDELESGVFWGRTHSGGIYTVDDKWILAVGNRDGAQALSQLLEPVGEQGWTVVLEKRSRDDEYAWGPVTVGAGHDLSYAEAEQVAYAFQTEGEVEFDFHRGIALSICGDPASGRFMAMLSERYDERRMVYVTEGDGGWRATGAVEIWSEHVGWFVKKPSDFKFPEQGYSDLDSVRANAYEWLIQPTLQETDRASAWWLGRCTNEVLLRKTV